MNTQLLDAVREITHKRVIKSMDDFTSDEIMGLTALYMDSLSVLDQLEMVLGNDPNKLLTNIKAVLRGEGAGAYGLMDPKNLLVHDITLNAIRWGFDVVEDALEQVITEEAHDSGVY